VGAADSLFVRAFAGKVDRQADILKRPADEIAYTGRLARGENVIVGLVLLHHQPHAAHIFARMAPVALCIEVGQAQPLPATEANRRSGPGDLASNKCLAAQWTLMVEEDAV